MLYIEHKWNWTPPLQRVSWSWRRRTWTTTAARPTAANVLPREGGSTWSEGRFYWTYFNPLSNWMDGSFYSPRSCSGYNGGLMWSGTGLSKSRRAHMRLWWKHCPKIGTQGQYYRSLWDWLEMFLQYICFLKFFFMILIKYCITL